MEEEEGGSAQAERGSGGGGDDDCDDEDGCETSGEGNGESCKDGRLHARTHALHFSKRAISKYAKHWRSYALARSRVIYVYLRVYVHSHKQIRHTHIYEDTFQRLSASLLNSPSSW